MNTFRPSESSIISVLDKVEEAQTGGERHVVILTGYPSKAAIAAAKARAAAEEGVPVERIDIVIGQGADEEYGEPLPYADAHHGNHSALELAGMAPPVLPLPVGAPRSQFSDDDF